jgi:O-antigen/teichoic acid export membrane protein
MKVDESLTQLPLLRRIALFIHRYKRVNWTLADQVVVSGSNFLCTYLLARYMGIADFGIYAVLLTGLQFLVSIQSTLITQPHNVLGARLAGVEYKAFTSALLCAQLILGTISTTFLMIVGLILFLVDAPSSGFLFLAIGLICGPWMAQEFIRRILYTQRDSLGAFLNDGVSYGLQLAGIIILIFFRGSPSITEALLVLGVSSLAAILAGAWQLRDHLTLEHLTFQGAMDHWKSARIFGQWLFAKNIANWFGSNGHTWLLLALLGPAMVGVYKAATHLVNVMNPIQQAAMSYLPSRASVSYSKQGSKGLRAWLDRTLRVTIIPQIIIGVSLIVLSKPALNVAYGTKFDSISLTFELEWIVIIAVFSRLMGFAAQLLQLTIMATNNTRVLFNISLVSVALLFTSGIVLIYLFGIFGASFSHLIIKSFTIIFLYIILIRTLK